MKNTIITEFVRFQSTNNDSTEELFSKSESMISFLKEQDGYLNAELVKDVQENSWCFIIRYENMDKVKALVEKLRFSKEFEEFKICIIPGSIQVSFNLQLKTW